MMQNPYYPQYPYPMPDQLAQLRSQPQYAPQSQMPQAQPPQTGINWVQGEEGAKAFLVAAGNSVLLMDSESSVFYLKSTDQSGMPQPLRIFDYTERTAKSTANIAKPEVMEAYATKEDVAALTAKVKALEASMKKEGGKNG